MTIPVENGRLPDGIHAATMEEIRAAFGTTPQRVLVIDAADVVIRRVRQIAGDVQVVLGGPVTDLRFEGILPLARVGAYVRDPVELERSMVDDQVFSIVTTNFVTFSGPVGRTDLREVHAVGGLVQALLVHSRSLHHLTWWAGRLMDHRGLEFPGGNSAGVLEVTE